MKLRRSFHINDEVVVRESKKPGLVVLQIEDRLAYLTEEEFLAMSDLRYRLEFAPDVQNEVANANS